uniref:Uncharacterized protein n=1 Tax=Rhodosorus marinus TaxID=101924 RepID=A0A7S2ZV05_9RHOD|mmetsp:Transcript_33722/g.132630  ORF Transcript_33722/g.132630 Transcript_33722/m.132630 type:complete len:237 (+) Transcript_33722:146-856(+)
MCFGGRLSYIMLGSSGVPVESVSASGNFEVGGPDRKAVGFSKDSCVTFLDWDDTLFASSHIALLLKDSEDLGGEVEEGLQSLQLAVIGLLKVASKISRVFIVTNANLVWVNEVLERWMPKVATYMHRNSVRVLSSRDFHELTHPGSPHLWKLRAFKDVLAILKYTSGKADNIIVVGDGLEEKEAASQLSQSERDCIVKMVGIPKSLSIESLVRQLALLTMSFRGIWASRKCMSIDL